MRLSALAPAKVNRELRVGRRRADGFHEIWSRIVSIDLADRLVAETADMLELECDDPAIPKDESNLVMRAARRLAARFGLEAKARLRLEKRVPVGGGLGGGSADAAVALRLLARLWEIPVGEQELGEIAAELGSDVRFFLFGGQAEVTGRGEEVTPLEDAPQTELLLLVPPFPVSTTAVYAAYAGRGRLPERLEVARPGGSRFFGPNDLAPSVLQMESAMNVYVESASGVSEDWAVSGSGATVAIRGALAEAQERLAARHPEARVLRCRTVTREDYRRRTDPTGGEP